MGVDTGIFVAYGFLIPIEKGLMLTENMNIEFNEDYYSDCSSDSENPFVNKLNECVTKIKNNQKIDYNEIISDLCKILQMNVDKTGAEEKIKDIIIKMSNNKHPCESCVTSNNSKFDKIDSDSDSDSNLSTLQLTSLFDRIFCSTCGHDQEAHKNLLENNCDNVSKQAVWQYDDINFLKKISFFTDHYDLKNNEMFVYIGYTKNTLFDMKTGGKSGLGWSIDDCIEIKATDEDKEKMKKFWKWVCEKIKPDYGSVGSYIYYYNH